VLREVAASLDLKPDQKAEVVTANLSEPEAASQLIAASEAAIGPVDILVNNAGLTRDGLLMRMKDEDWQTVLDVNLTAVMRLSRAVLRGMMKARWGRIIQISSVVGYTGNPGQTNYAASKAGMTGFTKSLAIEVASRGVTANVIAPGFIQTAMTDVLTDEVKAELLKRVPIGSMGTSEDIAAAVVYLASQEAGYLTGATLHINGGMAML
jgi:3-oxoacyl-[acyl-carrier protein] reductase